MTKYRAVTIGQKLKWKAEYLKPALKYFRLCPRRPRHIPGYVLANSDFSP
jgi:hypothetical protein